MSKLVQWKPQKKDVEPTAIRHQGSPQAYLLTLYVETQTLISRYMIALFVIYVVIMMTIRLCVQRVFSLLHGKDSYC